MSDQAQGREEPGASSESSEPEGQPVHEELRATQVRFELVQRAAGIGTWDWELRSNRAQCSEQYFRLYGLEPAGAMPSYEEWLARVHPEDRTRADREVKEAVAHPEEPYATEFRVLWPDGTVHWLVSRAMVLPAPDGEPGRMIGINLDITERKELEERILDYQEELEQRVMERTADLRASEGKFRGLFESVPDGIYQTTPEGRLLAGNPALVHLLGYESEDELRQIDLGSDCYIDPKDRERWKETLEREAELRNCEVGLRRKDGSEIIALDNAHAVRNEDGEVSYYEGTLTDITERKKAELRLEHLARFDALTDLPNRFLFEDRLKQALLQIDRLGGLIAVHYLDLDDFKRINDSLGHSFGDELLRAVAGRLSRTLRSTDTVSRLGGDEFTILQQQAPDVAAITAVARKLLDAVALPFNLEDHEIHTSASIGISLSEPGIDAEQLLSQADTALYKAKKKGHNSFEFHDQEMANEVREYLTLHEDLHGALDRDEFFLEYQPQFDLSGEAVVGSEALVRWRHPRRGLLGPAEFIPVCEHTGLIVPLGAWVLETACRQRQAWCERELPNVPVGVNLSAVQFQDPELMSKIDHTLETTNLSPELLEIELTESALMDCGPAVRDTLDQIRALGIRLTIDDFGTGYSSLRYMKTFHIDKLKIAMEFVQGVGTESPDASIIEAIISLGHALGCKVLAEGVDSEEQLRFLRERGCDEAQGFYLSPPLEPDVFAERVGRSPASSPAR